MQAARTAEITIKFSIVRGNKVKGHGQIPALLIIFCLLLKSCVYMYFIHIIFVAFETFHNFCTYTYVID
jgi:hypothetical protein